MRITFVRSYSARARVYVVRDDGSEQSWAFPNEPLHVAEIFANALWLRPEEGDVIENIERELGKRGHALPANVTAERVGAVSAELAKATEDWRGLADRGALVFEYP